MTCISAYTPRLQFEKMAYRKLAMKRTASKGAGGARKKQRGNAGVAKKCAVIAPTIKSAESLPQPVRSLIADRLMHVFGTYKDERHPFQNTVSNLVGGTLQATQASLQAAINEAQAKKGVQDAEGATLNAASNDALAASDAATQAAANGKASANANHTALKDAKAALHDLEAAVKTAEADTLATGAKKEKLEVLIKEFFVPVKEGTLDKGLSKSAAWAGKSLGKEFAANLEPEFLVCVVSTFSHAASAWGTFDYIIDKELDASLKTITAGLASELTAMEAAKGARGAQVENAKVAVAAAEESLKAAEEASSAAEAGAKEARAAAKAAASAVKKQQQLIRKAGSALDHAQHAMTSFQNGPLAAYTEVEAHVAPPPEPEPVPEAAPVEAAPLAEAMTAAPPAAARPSPSILPSPGVLFSRAAAGMAQAVGLAPSPRVASSPRQP